MKKQYLCIYLPMWSTDLLRAAAESPPEGNNKAAGSDRQRPLILYTRAATQVVVARFCRKAQNLGVKIDMPLPMARILAANGDKEAECLPFNAESDFTALCRLAIWSTKFSPLVAIDEELLRALKDGELCRASPLHNGLILDITGTERLHHGHQNLAAGLLRAFARRNMEARLAIAPAVGAAWAISRFSRQPLAVLDTGAKLDEALRLFPVAALRLTPDTVFNLKQLGLEKISDLLKLPRDSLGSRFGPQLLTRLEQALGLRDEPLHFARARESFSAERQFEIPLNNHESLKAITLDLFKEVLAQLGECGKKASCFVIEMRRLDRNRNPLPFRKEISLFHASANPGHIASVIQPVVESIQTEEGVSKVKVSARLTSQNKGCQEVLFVKQKPAGQAADAGGELVNHLLVRLGRDNLKQVFFEGSWIPEKSFSYRPVQSEDKSNAEDHVSCGRPPYLLNPPQAMKAVALLPDSPPARITWNGKRLKVVQGIGPERISAEWWHTALSDTQAGEVRDYFRVQDETGRWLWIFRDQKSAEWFVQGLWV